MRITLNNLTLREFFENGGIIIDKGGNRISYQEYNRGETYTATFQDAYIGDSHYTWNTTNSWFDYSGDSLEPKHGDPIGVPGTNFTKITETDPRWELYKEQRISRGFDDSELWDLAGSISGFIVPRLVAFKRYASGDYPARFDSGQEWVEVIDSMIYAFTNYDNRKDQKVQEGFNNFKEYFGYLGF